MYIYGLAILLTPLYFFSDRWISTLLQPPMRRKTRRRPTCRTTSDTGHPVSFQACVCSTLAPNLNLADALVRALCRGALRAGLLRAAWCTALCAWR